MDTFSGLVYLPFSVLRSFLLASSFTKKICSSRSKFCFVSGSLLGRAWSQEVTSFSKMVRKGVNYPVCVVSFGIVIQYVLYRLV